MDDTAQWEYRIGRAAYDVWAGLDTDKCTGRMTFDRLGVVRQEIWIRVAKVAAEAVLNYYPGGKPDVEV